MVEGRAGVRVGVRVRVRVRTLEARKVSRLKGEGTQTACWLLILGTQLRGTRSVSKVVRPMQ